MATSLTSATNPLGTAASAFSPSTVGQVTGQEQTLASWAAPYVTNMLGQTQALAQTPYQTYQGPLTAGAAPLQQQAFTQAGQLGMPTDLTQAAKSAGDIATTAGALSSDNTKFTDMFTKPTDYAPVGTSFTGMSATPGIGGLPQTVAQQYMNPYMQQVLAPQMQAMQRQADIQRQGLGAQAAMAGGLGGSRAGLMQNQLNAELMRQQQQATGQAYGQAYTQGLGQFNVEQQLKAQEAQFKAQQAMQAAQAGAQYDLAKQQATEASRQFGKQYGLQALAQQLAATQARGQMGISQADIARQNLAAQLGAGAAQRDITQQGVAADVAEFEKQRMYPYQQLQFQQAMLQGLPLQAVNYAYQQPSYFSNLMTGTGGLMDLYSRLFPQPPK